MQQGMYCIDDKIANYKKAFSKIENNDNNNNNNFVDDDDDDDEKK